MVMNVEGPLQLLIYLLIAGAIIAVLFWILGMLDLPPNVKNIITVVVSVIILIWLLVTFVPGLTAAVPLLVT